MITVTSGLKAGLRWLVRRTGFDLVRYRDGGLPPDFEPIHREIVEAVGRHTMTSPERLFGLIEGVRHIVRHDVPGSIVECGVYKGGSMMAAALTLLSEKVTDRELHLFDTFEGMSQPTAEDVDLFGEPVDEEYDRHQTNGSEGWLVCSEERVHEAVLSTGYPPDRVHMVKGKVEDTVPGAAPAEIALLRLDTDWYESTKHELEHLLPRLVSGGVLIIDDYGHFQGARKATDEHFAANGIPAFLSRLDYTGRLWVKP